MRKKILAAVSAITFIVTLVISVRYATGVRADMLADGMNELEALTMGILGFVWSMVMMGILFFMVVGIVILSRRRQTPHAH